MDEKRELVYELSKRTSRASEMLQSWSRQDILQVLCAEMGKERKYTGLTKLKIIENLLKIVAEKNSGVTDPELPSYPTGVQRTAKRKWKADYPSRLPIPVNDPGIGNGGNDTINAFYCKKYACKATLRQYDIFCKRCSCCICYEFDDNKDPSLWLICRSEPPFLGNSCAMSCHLECALKQEKSSIRKDKRHVFLDGSFCCVPCGKKLEAEVRLLTGVPMKTSRGINRLSLGPEVQKLCSSAVEPLDNMLFDAISHSSPNHSIPASLCSISPATVRFEDVCPTSVTVIVGFEEPLQGSIIGYTLWHIIGYTLWHRKACDRDYPIKSTCTMLVPNTRFVVMGLTPATEYLFKVVRESLVHGKFRFQQPAVGMKSSSSVEDETNNITPYGDQNDDRAENYGIYSKDTDNIVDVNSKFLDPLHSSCRLSMIFYTSPLAARVSYNAANATGGIHGKPLMCVSVLPFILVHGPSHRSSNNIR
ncbi:Vernalization5/VIN3-like, putative isoform 2 [Hibiscus syriacus]|uniref:Vernalization5/VIN3-like, putative isoform 2 n=1 Tax=Hibiscus syriacus TaxID=106335 RepID=A0A6A2XZF4_HIBSY|nr:Vernalization5/VIN3-like, putative isoform 2 [Hibiscus syriacus]